MTDARLGACPDSSAYQFGDEGALLFVVDAALDRRGSRCGQAHLARAAVRQRQQAALGSAFRALVEQVRRRDLPRVRGTG